MTSYASKWRVLQLVCSRGGSSLCKLILIGRVFFISHQRPPFARELEARGWKANRKGGTGTKPQLDFQPKRRKGILCSSCEDYFWNSQDALHISNFAVGNGHHCKSSLHGVFFFVLRVGPSFDDQGCVGPDFPVANGHGQKRTA